MHTTEKQRESVLITGGAGSLGRAFCRYLAPFCDVTAVDSNEWAVAELRAELPGIRVLLRDYADIRFDETPADYVVHLAAYKHVDLGEADPVPYVLNNVTKCQKLLEMASWYGAQTLFVSTDKAVEPISTYGFTKALGERLAAYHGASVARLGNIIGSSGSVIPVWEAAIRDKRPVRITDERMTRYLIEDTEAVPYVWSRFIAGDRLIVPEMGEPVRLMDMLAEVLRRHGFDTPADYLPGVETVGIRPGEKLHEKLRWDFEV